MTLVGFEPPLPDEDNEYVGTLTRTTRITTCGERMNADGVGSVCSINYVGDGFADVVFTLYEGQRGRYLQYIDNRAAYATLLPPRPAGPVNSVVTGTCDAAELAQLQSDYAEEQTAGSPSGQPLEVPEFPPLSLAAVVPDCVPAQPTTEHLDPDGARPTAMTASRPVTHRGPQRSVRLRRRR